MIQFRKMERDGHLEGEGGRIRKGKREKKTDGLGISNDSG
jgi:hypothetical protein